MQDGRLFAHNGVLLGLDALDTRLAELGAADLVQGDTDSERLGALITLERRRHDGEVNAGLTAAIGWVSDNLPVYALNLVMSTATELWALRYPATHELYLLDRPAGGAGTSRHLEARSPRISARSSNLSSVDSVLFATERMDDDPAWRLLEPGELVDVDASLTIDASTPFPAEPRHSLRLADLHPAAAASQHPASRADS